jgi:radical SAM protein with 4Fe4S-binding SPASM domain
MRIFKIKEILPQVPNLLFRGRLKFKFELLPFEARNITWKKKWNFLLAGLNQFFLPSRPLGSPAIAQVEPANVCNLHCPLCFTASQTSSRPPSLLSLETFKQFIDEMGDLLLLIVLWDWGEPFLNPHLTTMIEYAAAKNILVHTSTNGNIIFSDETAAQIIDSGLTSLVFGVDGALAETYKTYRKGGDLERVKENIRTLVRAKKRKSSPTPLLTLRFVAMQHNEAELVLAEKMAQDLGVDYFSIKSVDMPPERGKDLDRHYRPGEEKYQRYEYVNGTYTRVKKPFECMRPWKRITLDALGQVISCEYDYKNMHSFGPLDSEHPGLETWKSPRAKDFRQHFHKGHNDYYHCQSCTYKDLRGEECILEARPVSSSRARSV